MQAIKNTLNSEEGVVLLETMIALIAVGSVTYLIVNTDLLPGLKIKWDAINSALQNKWIR